MKIKIIACEVMREELLAVKREKETEFEFTLMGLHLYPEKLHNELQKLIERSKGYSRVILAFGLCGGAARGLAAQDGILTIPRVHDCIPVLLGSREAFYNIRTEEAGTFYLSCGWFRGDKITIDEYKRIKDRFGEKKAKSIFKRMYDSYKRMLFILTGNPNEAEAYGKATETAELLGLELETTKGSPAFFEKIVRGPWEDTDFINIPPHGTIREEDFFIDSAIEKV